MTKSVMTWTPAPYSARGKLLPQWFTRVCVCILVWACAAQLLAFTHLWHRHSSSSSSSSFYTWGIGIQWNPTRLFMAPSPPPPPPPTPPPPTRCLQPRIYRSNGYLKVSCNGGLNQMRSAICDMVTVARLLNLTLVVPELDKKSFWADPSDFDDIFDVGHFIASLSDEVHIVKRLPKRFSGNSSDNVLTMPPVSWSNEKYYIQQILPLFNKYKVIHFNKTDARLANNGLTIELQKLRCRVNYQALKFTPEIEALGNKLVELLQRKGSYVALHLRYEMDMLAFSGCTHGCSREEEEELKKMRYAYPWWREKEIDPEAKRLQGLCPLTPEETVLVLKALGFEKDAKIYIASGEIYGSDQRLRTFKAAFPYTVKKEMLLHPEELVRFHNHSSQMAALDYIVSVASDIFIPTYDGNMAKVVEGHRRYLGFRKSILLDRKKLVELLDLYANKTISWDEFAETIQRTHDNRDGQPACRHVLREKPKEEDFFYANPHECLVSKSECNVSKI